MGYCAASGCGVYDPYGKGKRAIVERGGGVAVWISACLHVAVGVMEEWKKIAENYSAKTLNAKFENGLVNT
jgi:hypothetical protein